MPSLASLKSPIKWVLFDLGGVICSLQPDQLRNRMISAGASREDLDEYLRYDAFSNSVQYSPNELFQLGRVQPKEFCAGLIKLCKTALSEKEIIKTIESRIGPENYGLNPILEVLSKRLRIACFSNTHEIHWHVMKRSYNAFRYFCSEFTSFEMGVGKPMPEAFSMVISRCASLPQECLLIDDKIRNVEAAQKFGLQAILYNEIGSLVKDLKSFNVL